jgi:hypothetical protein
LRKEAESALRTMHLSYGVIELMLILSPFVCGIIIRLLYKLITNIQIQTSQTISFVSMMVAVTVPLRAFSDSLRMWRIAKVAYKCINTFFDELI